jgi:hypothetical protein
MITRRADKEKTWQQESRKVEDQSEGLKKFDEMFDISRLYISACSNSVQLMPLHPILKFAMSSPLFSLNECVV